ncbi:MAG: hypothetical protein JWR81_2315 [Pseudonocardia sp.]|nr:hypothetical protein [Pseudonocardia sp.]
MAELVAVIDPPSTCIDGERSTWLPFDDTERAALAGHGALRRVALRVLPELHQAPPRARSRSRNFCTLPVAVIGSASTSTSRSGSLYGAIRRSVRR